MFRRLPVTSIALIIVFASIVGIPPTSGFFTKLYLIKGAFQMGQFQFILALLFSSLTALFIFFRLFESYFYGKKNDNLDASTRIKESRLLAIPLIGVSQDNNHGKEAGYNALTPGIALGVDGWLASNFQFGGSLGYTNSDVHWKKKRGSGRIQGPQGRRRRRW